MGNMHDQRRFRERKRKEGLKELRGIWVHPDDYKQIKDHIKILIENLPVNRK